MTHKLLTLFLIFSIISCPIRCSIGGCESCCGAMGFDRAQDLAGEDQSERNQTLSDEQSQVRGHCCCTLVSPDASCDRDIPVRQNEFGEEPQCPSPQSPSHQCPCSKMDCLCGGAILSAEFGIPQMTTESSTAIGTTKSLVSSSHGNQSSLSLTGPDPGRLNIGRLKLNLHSTLQL